MVIPPEGFLLAQSTATYDTTATVTTTPAPTPPPAAPAATPSATEPDEKKLPPEQLDSLVAPIALYSDALLAQTLVASTYPLEIVALQQWLAKNKSLTGQALTDAVAKQPWDPSIQAMASLPDLVKRLADDIQWTTELGNAFLAQQSDVMDAVQRMRKKAQDKGSLKTTEQQKVETKVIEEKTVIVVEQTNPEVVYVPSYNPTVVYGPPPVYYSYPPVYYPPPPPPGYAFMSFSVGVMVGAAFWGGGCGWGHNEINIDVDRNVNRNVDRNTNRNTNANRNTAGGNSRGGGGSTWSHDSSHRGAAPYSNKSTANKFSGSSASARTQSQGASGNRVSSTQQSLSSRSGGASGARSGGASPSASSRSAGAGGAGSRGGGSSNIGSR
ncbi:MAG TPA: DUF3300 domain-containing protein, partial [Candidatus Didemnitutus sp.]|nr:DUF3300 domain-containing protein [Candidatus Didemnitutus sp.]